METRAETPRLLTPEEAAHELRVTRQTIYRMTNDGRLPAYRLGEGGPLRLEREAVAALLRPVTARRDET